MRGWRRRWTDISQKQNAENKQKFQNTKLDESFGLAAAVDGYISIVAALCAVRLCPRVRDALFLSHASYEIGYRLAARELGLEPCLLLGMRLGEGSGCPLLFRVMQGACAVLNHMATFPEAAIEDGYLAPIRQGDAFTVDKS